MGENDKYYCSYNKSIFTSHQCQCTACTSHQCTACTSHQCTACINALHVRRININVLHVRRINALHVRRINALHVRRINALHASHYKVKIIQYEVKFYLPVRIPPTLAWCLEIGWFQHVVQPLHWLQHGLEVQKNRNRVKIWLLLVS